MREPRPTVDRAASHGLVLFPHGSRRARKCLQTRFGTRRCRIGLYLWSVTPAVSVLLCSFSFELTPRNLSGFSFHGSPRPPFDSVLRALKAHDAPPVLSVDIPSGWDVEQGDVNGDGLRPGK